MANGWTEERKQKQRELIQNWKPWEQSTGAKTPGGKGRSSKNAYKYGATEIRVMLLELRKMLKEEKSILIESLGI